MSRDAVNMKSHNSKEVPAQDRDTTIDINDVTMEQIWNVHKLLCSSDLEEQRSTLASEMVTRVVRSSFVMSSLTNLFVKGGGVNSLN